MLPRSTWYRHKKYRDLDAQVALEQASRSEHNGKQTLRTCCLENLALSVNQLQTLGHNLPTTTSRTLTPMEILSWYGLRAICCTYID